ncbi:MAG: hypothetical protein C0518_01035 [Opitutus sp.]|nr:hypothetical protein [Opitutus sp.]
MNDPINDFWQGLRPEFLEGVFARVVAQKNELTPADRAVLEETVAGFLSRNRAALSCLLASPSFVAEHPELLDKLLRDAWQCAPGPEERTWIQAQASRAGRKDFRGTPKPRTELLLTASQKRVFEELRAIAEVFFEGRDLGPIAPRWTTLIIGPTGIGKSHLVRRLADQLGLEAVRVGVSSWVPAGAKLDPTSLTVVLDHVRKGTRFVLHLEEADKLAGSRTDAWSQGQLSELLMLLDGAPGAPWTDRDRFLFRRNALVVATGAWQEIFERTSPGLGFGAQRAETDRRSEVQRAGKIPAELLARFGQHLILEPLTTEDFQGLAGQLKLGREHYDPEAGVASGQNMRYLESCMAQRELQRARAELRLRERAKPVPTRDR